MEVMHECIPQSTLRTRRNLPWLTKPIIQAIRRRNALFRAHKRAKSTSAYQQYRAARNRVVAMLRLSKTKFFRDLKSQGLKAFWKSMKLLNNQVCSIPTLSSNDIAVSDNHDKAALLNSFFHSCFNDKCPPLTDAPSSLQSAAFPPELLCDEAEVFDLILSLDPAKSTGPDGISAKMLRGSVDAIAPSLTRLFNISLSTGVLPNTWKQARIVPVPKSGNTSDPSNYRPISILSVVSKLLERHVHQLLLHHLTVNHPLSARQWGFLPQRCTASALLSVTHDWLQQLELGNETCVVFFDLKKAFDSVPHSLLLQRLHEIDVNQYLVQWVHNYLLNRSQMVVVGGEESSTLPVISGVPQGSVLGPLLFLIFINDIVHQISPGSSISLFADDIALYRPILTVLDYSILQNDVSSLAVWINNSLLALQPAKCNYMLISRRSSPRLPPPNISVQGSPLSLVSSVKYLGILINSDLSWSPHVSNLCNKVRKLVGLLYRRFYKHADSSTLLTLYKAFIRPHLEYNSIVWDPYLIGDINSLEKIQRFALRVCLKSWTTDREHLYSQSHIPALDDRRKQARLCHMYKIVNDLTDFPEAPFQFRAINFVTRFSHDQQLRNIAARTSQYQNSFFPRTIAQWNSLPADIVNSSSFFTFKTHLKLHH